MRRGLLFNLLRRLLWLVPLCGMPFRALAADPARSPLGFADSLYAEGDDYRAITEYRRFLWEHPSDPASSYAWLQIGRAYVHGRKWMPALKALQRAQDTAGGDEAWGRARTALGDLELARSSYEAAVFHYQTVLEYEPASAPLVSPRLTLAYLAEGRSDLAFQAAATAPQGIRAALEGGLNDWGRLPRRSPALAGILSLVVPGSGQLYAGRPGEALSAFFVNGLLGLAAYEAFSNRLYAVGGVVAFFGLGFYGGNVYGAVNAAERRNRAIEDQLLDRMRAQAAPDLPPFTPSP